MKPSEITVKVNVEFDADAQEMIRKIVREEIAAREERLVESVKESLHKNVTEYLAGFGGSDDDTPE